MSERPFRSNEVRMARPRPHGPDEARGVPRVDGRRVILGIVHVLRTCCRWADAPSDAPPRGPRGRGRPACEGPRRWLRRLRASLGQRWRGGSSRRASVCRAGGHRCPSGRCLGKRLERDRDPRVLGSAAPSRSADAHRRRCRGPHGGRTPAGAPPARCARRDRPLLGHRHAMPRRAVDEGRDGAAIRDRVTGPGALPDLPPRKTRRRRVVRRRGFHRDRDAVERMSGRRADALPPSRRPRRRKHLPVMRPGPRSGPPRTGLRAHAEDPSHPFRPHHRPRAARLRLPRPCDRERSGRQRALPTATRHSRESRRLAWHPSRAAPAYGAARRGDPGRSPAYLTRPAGIGAAPRERRASAITGRASRQPSTGRSGRREPIAGGPDAPWAGASRRRFERVGKRQHGRAENRGPSLPGRRPGRPVHTHRRSVVGHDQAARSVIPLSGHLRLMPRGAADALDMAGSSRCPSHAIPRRDRRRRERSTAPVIPRYPWNPARTNTAGHAPDCEVTDPRWRPSPDPRPVNRPGPPRIRRACRRPRTLARRPSVHPQAWVAPAARGRPSHATIRATARRI